MAADDADDAEVTIADDAAADDDDATICDVDVEVASSIAAATFFLAST